MSKAATKSKPYVRLEKNAVRILKAFGERQIIKSLSNAQLVNALIEEYEWLTKKYVEAVGVPPVKK
jgi:hypothetical protein